MTCKAKMASRVYHILYVSTTPPPHPLLHPTSLHTSTFTPHLPLHIHYPTLTSLHTPTIPPHLPSHMHTPSSHAPPHTSFLLTTHTPLLTHIPSSSRTHPPPHTHTYTHQGHGTGLPSAHTGCHQVSGLVCYCGVVEVTPAAVQQDDTP